ncbi:precorrin-6y C5,15-methyltransferase (decarboxylating) subunit CbiE [Rugamonas sp. FT107W]|uniref:Precorrin-6y C5,15-methyltransferase (Decarboxylating) subunit CbiE n=1 Tax=Duganella vulcania TaxID=2692166 RepID=A0A845HR18_9BURK|nr:precorrin-6y C5,15-methyltransferase (decarboxylating) subunit CbiE [Duganella vulcania]MYN19945.1 precorrin-6y C5,15-methyltransferase (decarboxylating) subunit CbiE [Duganella vulcania]
MHTQDPNPCRVIGVLDDGIASLSPTALALLRSADMLIGGARTLALLEREFKPGAMRHDLTGKLKEVPEWVRSARADNLSCVVLATGDPLCHGIAPYLAQHLCVEALDILPNLSTLQLACARIGLAWQDARIVSVHARDAGEWQRGSVPGHGLYALAQAARQHARLLVLTSPDNSPDRIARLLLAEGLGDDFLMAVAENLLQPEERVLAELTPQQAAGMRFAALNVVLLWRVTPAAQPVRFGLADAEFAQRQPEKGLITKQEVRAVSLARLQLRADSVVWDIGAGSGSVGLEAARLCPQGHVYATEKNEADFAIAGQNHAAFGVSNYSLYLGKAPEGLDAWPDPDAVFIGGSGGELAGLIAGVIARLRPRGTLVMNFVTLENLATATATLQALKGVEWDVLQLQAARSKPILHMHRMAAENPVWIVCARRAEAKVAADE